MENLKVSVAVTFLANLCLAMLSVPVSKVDAEKASGYWPMFHKSCHYRHRDDISI